MKTFTVKKGNNNYTTGWHTNTITNAKYDTYGDAKYIDVFFEGYKNHFKLRIYERINKDDEEFAISNLFRFANAGITDALDSGDKNVIVKFDDSADNLAGKQINVYYYKDAKGYTACLNQVAPTSFKNIADDFSEDDVAYYKNKAENYYQKYILPKIKQKTEHTTVEEVADVPF